MPTALITGASRGLGRALAETFDRRGWNLVLDARGGEELTRATAPLGRRTVVRAIRGDVRDPAHRATLAGAAAELGDLQLVVNNASQLGPTPLPTLLELSPEALTNVMAINAVAPLAVLQAVRMALSPGAVVVNVSSDAAVEASAGWGGYGASKAALEHLSRVLAVERPDLRVYALDPGDMRTELHQAAFPGEDIADRPEPDTVVPAFLRLLEERPPSGRVRAADLLAEVTA